MRLSVVTAGRPARAKAPEERTGRRIGRVLGVLALLALVLGVLAGAFFAGAVLHRNGTLTEYLIAFQSRSSPRYWLGLAFAGESLPTVRVDMKFKNVQKISAKRDEALANRILDASDADFVKADWQFQGRDLPVKMRLKGDWVDHLRGDKWSYRVHVENDETFLGMRHFSIQHPGTRNYLFEWAYQEHLRAEGLLGLRYEFVSVVFNGRKLGAFAVEEHFSRELVESQRRRDGPIVKFDEDALWKQRIVNTRRQGPYSDAFLLDSDDAIYDPNEFTSAVASFGSKKMLGDPALRSRHETAIGLLRGYSEGRLAASAVFDPELTGKFLALVELWSAEHQLDWHNLRFYFNTVTGKLEPIGFDGEPPNQPASLLLAPSWGFALLDDPSIGAAYVRALERMTTDAYLKDLETRLGARYRQLASALFWEFGALPEPWPVLAERSRQIRLELGPVKEIAAYVSRREAGGGWVVDVRSLVTLPVEIGTVRVEGFDEVPAASLVLDPAAPGGAVLAAGSLYLKPTRSTREATAAEYVSLRLPATGHAPATAQPPATPPPATPPPAIELTYRLAGEEAWRQEIAAPYAAPLAQRILEAPTVAAALAAHPFLRYDDAARELAVKPGDWEVAGDLVLPDHVPLVIAGGTRLRFAPGASLRATAALRFAGEPERPIVLGPRQESWAGILVVGAAGESEWSSVEVASTTGVTIPGLALTGGVTFYESPLKVRDSRFNGSRAEDALDVVRGRVELTRVEFADCASDAFAGDFADARVLDGSFHDVHGDCLEVTGSRLQLERIVAVRIGDAIVSASEGSTVHAHAISGDGVGIGIASADRSQVIADGVTVRNARTAALAAYTKKAEYGPASLNVIGLVTSGCPALTVVDLGSSIEVDGQHIEGDAKLDVAQLHKTQTPGK